MARVLLTDDEVVFVESLAKILRKRDFQVVTAHDGGAAVAAVECEAFDAIVLDLRMPGMDGLATLEEIRRRDPFVHVLLLSGHAELEKVETALRRGAADYLLKPCPVDALVSAIEDGCERTALAREAAARSVSR